MTHQAHSCGCGCHGSDEHGSSHAALDILDERFARGEIEKAEYEEKKQLISQRPAAKPDFPAPHAAGGSEHEANSCQPIASVAESNVSAPSSVPPDEPW